MAAIHDHLEEVGIHSYVGIWTLAWADEQRHMGDFLNQSECDVTLMLSP